MDRKIFSVYQVNRYIKAMLEDDFLLADIFIEAEISNFKRHPSGHLYFTLKDEKAAISAVMFKSSAAGLTCEPENGMRVIAYGRISLYEKTGQYQLYTEFLESAGQGNVHAAFEQLKRKLLAEGLFDASHKKEIPRFPSCVAVVTSGTGAAIRDIIQIMRRRNKLISIVVVPVLVQGVSAAEDIAAAIALVNKWGGADCMIIGRGGGSSEDLQPFNEEIVARAIFKSSIPVISAVGHETDFTISDFVADYRAPTPSAAAEIVSPQLDELQAVSTFLRRRLYNAMQNKITLNRKTVKSLISRRSFREPLTAVYDRQLYIHGLSKRLYKDMIHKIQNGKLWLSQQAAVLEALSPIAVLRKGYALILDDAGNLVTGAEEVRINQMLDVTFHDGVVHVGVAGVEVKDVGGNG